MKRRAFTLVELLVVIAIIGLLSSVAVMSTTSARAKARDAKRIGDKDAIIKAINLYYQDNGSWPSDGGNWRCFGAPTSEGCWGGSYNGLDSLRTAMTPYMANFPVTGATTGNYAYNRYLYASNWSGSGVTGAFLIWPKETPFGSSECPSPHPLQAYDDYVYCYEYLGS